MCITGSVLTRQQTSSTTLLPPWLQFQLVIPQKVETAPGAKVEIRGWHLQLWRLPRGRSQQGPWRQWKRAENLWRLLITSPWLWSKVLSVQTCGSSKRQLRRGLHKCYFQSTLFSAVHTANIFLQIQLMYFHKLRKHISECSADIFLLDFLM